jgi:thymidylate synthase
MNNLDYQYQELIRKILTVGTKRMDRTGTGTISIFGAQLRHDMSEGFPLLTTKKMAVKSMMTELKWFLKGDTNIKYLIENNCHIWNGDAMKNYEKKNGEIDWGHFITKEEVFVDSILNTSGFAEQWGELGPIYGNQWRKWKTFRSTNPNANKVGTDSVEYVDQIKELIHGLKTNPYGRRHMVSAWNVGQLDQMVLPPCHYGFQCYIADGKLSLMWNQRSVDTFLGLPFNLASYGTLLELLAIEVGAEPGELICNLGDVHLYSNHIEQAEELISREPYQLPTIQFKDIDILAGEWEYEIKDYQSHPAIKAPLSN